MITTSTGNNYKYLGAGGIYASAREILALISGNLVTSVTGSKKFPDGGRFGPPWLDIALSVSEYSSAWNGGYFWSPAGTSILAGRRAASVRAHKTSVAALILIAVPV
jgi:hypothetical protein